MSLSNISSWHNNIFFQFQFNSNIFLNKCINTISNGIAHGSPSITKDIKYNDKNNSYFYYRTISPILFSGHPGISVNELSPLSLRRCNIRHFKFDFHRLKMADSLLLEEVTSPRKRELCNVKFYLPIYFNTSVTINLL